LETLFVSYNKIRKLPKKISKLRNLQMLCIGYNQLESLPDNIDKMSNLQHLTADNNKLKSIPEGIVELNLTGINIDGNPGKFVSGEFGIHRIQHIRDTRMFYKKYFSLALGCTYPVLCAIIIMSPVRLG
jgi:Leucine-rich repeat (LRR) protein